MVLCNQSHCVFFFGYTSPLCIQKLLCGLPLNPDKYEDIFLPFSVQNGRIPCSHSLPLSLPVPLDAAGRSLRVAVSSSDTLITLGQAFTDQEIKAVIKRCRLEDFVNSLPDGLDTMIKEKYIIARTEIR